MDKASLRKEFLKKREAIGDKDVAKQSELIIEKLKARQEFKKAKKILLYLSKDREVDTHALVKGLLKSKEVFVPRVKINALECVRLKTWNDLAIGNFGVLEPASGEIVDINSIEIVVLPAIAFDKHGNRLGYGKGFYDNLLKNYKGKKIGLAFGFQVVKSLPQDEWDIKVDEVIMDTP